jgi:hypothetical protein
LSSGEEVSEPCGRVSFVAQLEAIKNVISLYFSISVEFIACDISSGVHCLV